MEVERSQNAWQRDRRNRPEFMRNFALCVRAFPRDPLSSCRNLQWILNFRTFMSGFRSAFSLPPHFLPVKSVGAPGGQEDLARVGAERMQARFLRQLALCVTVCL